MRNTLLALLVVACATRTPGPAPAPEPGPGPAAADLAAAAAAARAELIERFPAEKDRVERGCDQVLAAWRPEDGPPDVLGAFLRDEFLPRGETLDATFARLEFAFERLGGYLVSMNRDLKRGLDLDEGPQLHVDEKLANFDLGTHVTDDLFNSRIAFVVLLNFPLTTLEQRLAEGAAWNRRQWAEARLALAFAERLPADVKQRVRAAEVAAEGYVNDYNIFMHHVLAADGTRPFPPKLRLISHWNLRDELKARYADPEGLSKQRLIYNVMLRIVRQEIPLAVVNNPLLDWQPESNEVDVSPVKDVEPPEGAVADPRTDREPDRRYAYLLDIFRAQKAVDAFDPLYPTYLHRRFDRDREIPVADARSLLEDILTAPQGKEVAALASKRLGRPLEPFDIWYSFKPARDKGEAELDKLTRKRYPTPKAFGEDIPRILKALGFAKDRAAWVQKRIVVDPSRGPGHAMGPARRDDAAHLRTRVGKDGMDYKGYNIAVHELGHNVEQVFSTIAIDHTLLQGVPNNAFTEAMAFVFQARDLELLGVAKKGKETGALETLDQFWSAREIAGVSLVDIGVWEWMYENPEATVSELRAAVVSIADDVWNRYFADALGGRDVPLLAIYSHMLAYPLYLPDYAIGQTIAFQLTKHFRALKGPMGPEFERMTKLGMLTPDLWMRTAVGEPVGAQPLIDATTEALGQFRGKN